MKLLFPILLLALLAGCGPAPTPTAAATLPPTVTRTPTETPLPTATPIPTYSIEQLNSMASEQKLASAPQVTEAPQDVVASYLSSGVDASRITWNEEKTLSFWDRVVTYHGVTSEGQDVTLYYDLESGQWAKKYNSFEEVKLIAADQIPDVMVITDNIGDHLVRNKNQYSEDWISQPQSMIDGKMVFRDEKGYPKAVWNTVNQKWLTPEEADVVWTFDKFKAVSNVPFTTQYGEGNYNYLFNEKWSEFITDSNKIESLPNGTFILVLNPSGEIQVWTSQKDAANRAKEGATIIVGRGETQTERNDNFSDKATWQIAFDQYKKGNKSLFVTYGDVGVSLSEIEGSFILGTGYSVEELPQITDSKTGRIVCPVIRLPKHAKALYGIGNPSQPLNDPFYWLDYLIRSGATKIGIRSVK
ncbi:MAG: hypothetical protein ACOYZ8_00120 [Chloroflexota bacterium]